MKLYTYQRKGASPRMEQTAFERIYTVVRQIPRGKVATYGMVAQWAGNPKWARAVGYALHANPEPGIIPCHRVVNRMGRLTPAFAFGGEDVQRRLLAEEGVTFREDGCVNLEQHLWNGLTEGSQ